MASTCILSLPNDTSPTTLDYDPAEYRDNPAPRRSSAHVTQGDRVHQDFGAPGADREIWLRCDWVAQGTLDALQTKFETTGQPWKWVDFKGNSYLVFFRSLAPERIRGQEAYVVEITFDVLEVL
jgi:hypothetical protein